MGKANKQGGAFDTLAELMGGSDLAGLTSQDESNNFSVLAIDEIDVKDQVRKVFDGEDSTIAELAESIKVHGVMQPVIVRPADGDKPYELVAGERRLRASILAGLASIPAMVRELDDDSARSVQLAENTHRLNLAQLELAAELQRDFEELGEDIEALMAKRQKSRAWISKLLSLNSLGEQATRVLVENVSADLEVINTVKQVEKVSPDAAKELVDDLKAAQSDKDSKAARKIAKEAKDAVKPPKKKKKESTVSNPDAVAQPIDKSHEENGPVVTIDVTGTPEMLLKDAYVRIYQEAGTAQAALESLTDEARDAVENWLTAFYEQGIEAKDVGSAVIRGFRSGVFSTENHGAFALAAFLYGLDSEGKFSLLNILGSVKA